MSRQMTLLLSLFAVGLPATLTVAPAQGAALPSAPATASAPGPSDLAPGDVADDPSADDSSADDSGTDPADTADTCDVTAVDDSGTDPASLDGSDDPTAADQSVVTIDLGSFDTGALDPGAGDPSSTDGSDGTDPTDTSDSADVPDPCAAAADPAGEASDGGTTTVTRSALLKGGVLKTGTVSVTGAGRVTQQLWLPAGGHGRHGLRAAVARKGGKARTATGGKLLGGSVTRTVTKAGVVNLSVRLNKAARAQLRRAKTSVTITVKTTTTPKGGKAVTRTGTVVVKK